MARVLVTGIGRATSIELAARAHHVIATARRPETLVSNALIWHDDRDGYAPAWEARQHGAGDRLQASAVARVIADTIGSKYCANSSQLLSQRWSLPLRSEWALTRGRLCVRE